MAARLEWASELRRTRALPLVNGASYRLTKLTCAPLGVFEAATLSA